MSRGPRALLTPTIDAWGRWASRCPSAEDIMHNINYTVMIYAFPTMKVRPSWLAGTVPCPQPVTLTRPFPPPSRLACELAAHSLGSGHPSLVGLSLLVISQS